MSKKKIVEDTITFPTIEFDALAINPHDIFIGEPQTKAKLTKASVIKELDAYADAAAKALSPGQLRTEAYRLKYEQALALKNKVEGVDISLVYDESKLRSTDPLILAEAIIKARNNMMKRINDLELIRVEYNNIVSSTADEDLANVLETYRIDIDKCLN
jgi:hypothetical protein